MTSINHLPSSSYFCSNCQHQIQNETEYKMHYKSEFHRYNLKRRMIDLAPLSFDKYLQKKTQLEQKQSSGTQIVNETFRCEICKKQFATKSTYSQHMESKKHKQEEAAQKNKVKIIKQEEQFYQEPTQTTMDDVSICLFCNEKSEDLEKNILHMQKIHSFFIMERQYCKNVEDLIKYVAEKINVGLLCLYCDNKGTKDFKSAEALQNHMKDKGHCFMNSDNFDEFTNFYDFSETFKELEAFQKQSKRTKSIKNDEQKSNSDWTDQDDEEDEWEDDEDEQDEFKQDDQDDQSDELKDKKKETEKFRKNLYRNKKTQKYKIKNAKVLPSGELQLPTGKIIGHRMYRANYKQYFRTNGINSFRMKALLGSNYESRIALIKEQTTKLAMMRYIYRGAETKVQDRIMDKIQQRQGVKRLNQGLKSNRLVVMDRQDIIFS